MKIEDLKQRLLECVTCLEFEYDDIQGGIDPFAKDDFTLFFGDVSIKVNSIDEVFNTKFINGNTLTQIFDDVNIIVY